MLIFGNVNGEIELVIYNIVHKSYLYHSLLEFEDEGESPCLHPYFQQLWRQFKDLVQDKLRKPCNITKAA